MNSQKSIRLLDSGLMRCKRSRRKSIFIKVEYQGKQHTFLHPILPGDSPRTPNQLFSDLEQTISSVLGITRKGA